eukprot:763029-Hanusia_phi.AAC.1
MHHGYNPLPPEGGPSTTTDRSDCLQRHETGGPEVLTLIIETYQLVTGSSDIEFHIPSEISCASPSCPLLSVFALTKSSIQIRPSHPPLLAPLRMSHPPQTPSLAPVHSVCINARVRKHDTEQSARAVHLTISALQPLFNVKQEEAAAMLGLSLTSLKSACRRLGLARWPYTRPRLDVELDVSGQIDDSKQTETSREHEPSVAVQEDIQKQSTCNADTRAATQEAIYPDPDPAGTLLEEFRENSEDALVDNSWIS